MQRMIWIVCLTAVLALANQSARADDLLLLGTSTDAATMTLAYQGDGETVLVHGGWGGRGWGGWGRGWGGYGWGGYGWGGYGWSGYGWGGYGWGGYGSAGYYGYPYYASYGASYPTYYYSSGCGCSSPYVGSYYSAPAYYYYGYSSTPTSYYSYQPTAVVIAPLAQAQPQQNGTVVPSPGATVSYVLQAAYQPTASSVAPSAVVPVIAPLQVVPPAGFEYDGGPASPVPMPGGERVIPQKKNPDLKDVRFEAPHSNSSKFVYSAYGEQAKPVVEMPAATTLMSQTTDL